MPQDAQDMLVARSLERLTMTQQGVRETVLRIAQCLYDAHTPDVAQAMLLIDQLSHVLDVADSGRLRQVFLDLNKALSACTSLRTVQDAAAPVRTLLWAVLEYHDQLCEGRTVSLLYLYSYYEKAMLALDAHRVHPADLYFYPRDQHVQPSRLPVVRKLHEDQNYDALSIAFELLLQAYPKATDPVAQIYTPALQIVRKVAGAQDFAEDRAVWTTLGAALEVLIDHAQPQARHVWLFLEQLGQQLRLRKQGPIRVEFRVLNDALFLIAHGHSDPVSQAEQLIASLPLARVTPSDYLRHDYPAANPVALEQLSELNRQLRKAWYGYLEGVPKQLPLLHRYAEEMRDLANGLGQPDLKDLFTLFRRLSMEIDTHRNAPQMLREISGFILLLGASLSAFYTLPAGFAKIVQDANHRLNHPHTQSGQFGREERTFMTQVDSMQCAVSLLDALLSSQEQAETLLTEYFLVARQYTVLVRVQAIITGMHQVMQMADYAEGVLALQAAASRIEQAGSQLLEQEQAWQLVYNIAILKWYLSDVRLSGRTACKRYVFDSHLGVLNLAGDRAAELAVHSCQKFMLSQSVVQAAARKVEAVPAEEDDGVLAVFLQQMAGWMADMDSVMPLLRAAPHDEAQLEVLQYGFYQMQEASQMAMVPVLPGLCAQVSDYLRAVQASGVHDLQMADRLAHLMTALQQWLALPHSARLAEDSLLAVAESADRLTGMRDV